MAAWAREPDTAHVIGSAAAVTGALALAGSGQAALLLAAADSGGNDLTVWLQGGGSAAAVAGLVYVARMIVKGDLVPRAVAERENETAAAVAATARREQDLQHLVAEGHGREKTLDRIAGETVRINAEVLAELRWWREQRERGQTVTLPPPGSGS